MQANLIDSTHIFQSLLPTFTILKQFIIIFKKHLTFHFNHVNYSLIPKSVEEKSKVHDFLQKASVAEKKQENFT